MKKKYFLGSALLILGTFLILGILSYGIYYKCSRATLFLRAGYWGTCSVCNCLYEVPSSQISIIRQGDRPTCLICPRCQKNR